MILVRPPNAPKCTKLMVMHYMKHFLPTVIVKGLPSVNRAVIHADEKTGDRFELFVDGTNFSEVLAIPETNGVRTKYAYIFIFCCE